MDCIHNKDEQEHCEQCNCDKPQHTPTPWEINGLEIQAKNKHETLICEVYDENGFNRANAAFIVKACNNHFALVEALKIALEALEPLENEIAETAKDAIQTALSQVEKG